MTTVSRFSRQNEAGLRALNVFLVVVLVLESKAFVHIRPCKRHAFVPYILKMKTNLDCSLKAVFNKRR